MKKLIVGVLILISVVSKAQLVTGNTVVAKDSLKVLSTWYKQLLSDSYISNDTLFVKKAGALYYYVIPTTEQGITSITAGTYLTGGTITSSGTIGVGAELTALATYSALNGSGIVVKTAPNTFTNRTIAVSYPLSISNDDGVSGNPSIEFDTDVLDTLRTKVVFISDTALMLSPYMLSNVANAALGLKVNVSDTASMLSPYPRTNVVNASLGLKLNISDTASMLTGYLRKTGGAISGPITYSGIPVLAEELINKNYLDNALTGITWKNAVKVKTTGNHSLSGTSNVDGTTIPSGTRVLVASQTDQTQNGIYISAAGAWTRATDCDAAEEIQTSTVFITNGTVNKNTQWTCTAIDITLGVSNITFGQIAGAGTYTNGSGITLTANVFSITPLGITNSMVNDVGWSKITGTPTNKSGYGITDVVAYSDTASMLSPYQRTFTAPFTRGAFSGITGSLNYIYPTRITDTVFFGSNNAAMAKFNFVGSTNLYGPTSFGSVSPNASYVANFSGRTLFTAVCSNQDGTLFNPYLLNTGTTSLGRALYINPLQSASISYNGTSIGAEIIMQSQNTGVATFIGSRSDITPITSSLFVGRKFMGYAVGNTERDNITGYGMSYAKVADTVYQFYADSMSTLNPLGYAFYQKGTNSLNYFSGKVGLLTNAPTHTLTLGSTSTGIASYNTSDQTTNYERVRQYWSGNVYNIQQENGGTGINRSMVIGSSTSGGDVTIRGDNVNISGGNSIVATGAFSTSTDMLVGGSLYFSDAVNVTKSILFNRQTTNTAGTQNLTVTAGAPSTSNSVTNTNGGELLLKGGISKGTGTSWISFYTAAAGASGFADNTPAERIRITGAGNLTFTNDGTNDIGALGASRPRSGYFQSSLFSPAYNSASGSISFSVSGGTTNTPIYNFVGGSNSATSSTNIMHNFGGTFNPASGTPTDIGLNIAPVINWGGTPGAGSYEGLRVNVTETSVPIGANKFLLSLGTGGASFSRVFSVDNTGTVSMQGTLNATNCIVGPTAFVMNYDNSATSRDGYIAVINNAATVGAPIHYSPRFRFRGTSWTGAASQASDFTIENKPNSGTTPVTANLVFGSSVNGSAYSDIMQLSDLGKITLLSTITAAGTTGAQTINKSTGQVNFAAGATTLVVTNSLATTSSQIMVTVYGADATAVSARVTKAAGSFTITLNAAATAETAVGFWVIN